MLDLIDKSIIGKLQHDIPLSKHPYKIIAEELGIEEQELLRRIKILYEKDILKRIGAILYYKVLGFKANALVVWKVPMNNVDQVGKYLALIAEISHCYERTTSQNWEYNVYTMIHGRTYLQCEKKISEIATKINIFDYKILYSIKELKKSSMSYFTSKNKPR